MYINNQIGDLGQVPAVAKTLIPKVAGTIVGGISIPGTAVALPGIATMLGVSSSVAGPIGMVVGGIISLFMSLFGPDPKKPIFGIGIIVPQGQKPTFGRVLAYLQKQQFDVKEGWGLHKADIDLITSAFRHIDSLMSAGEPGAIVIESGGLPTAVQTAKQTDFNGITNHLRQVAAPYVSFVNSITNPEVKNDLLETVLPFSQAKNYYLNLDLRKYASDAGKMHQTLWDEYAVTGKNQDLSKTLSKGFNSILSEFNKTIIEKTGVDPQTGTIVNPDLAALAFPEPAFPSLEIGGVNLMPLLLLGGLAYIVTR